MIELEQGLSSPCGKACDIMYETMRGVIAEDITALDKERLVYESDNEYEFMVRLKWEVTAQDRDFAVETIQDAIDYWWESDPSECLSECVHVALNKAGIKHQLFTLTYDYGEE